MVCAISDNEPLSRLMADLNLAPRCHGWRPHCVHGFAAVTGNVVLGLPGTALGYCQALFGYAGDPLRHTEKVIEVLEQIGAPWSKSHELFWGNRRPEEAVCDFLEQSVRPLIGGGRVPILISGLDPAADCKTIEAINKARPAVPENESVLLRVVLKNEASVRQITGLMKRALGESHLAGAMPPWWPLLQGILDDDGWMKLQELLGSDWRYSNVAVNPFVTDAQFDLLAPQITVAQIPIGLAAGMSDDGVIRLASGMRIHGAPEGASYSLFDYIEKLSKLPSTPTLIILGPSLPEWSDKVNAQRIERLLPLLRRACDRLWCMLPAERRDAVWKMVA